MRCVIVIPAVALMVLAGCRPKDSQAPEQQKAPSKPAPKPLEDELGWDRAQRLLGAGGDTIERVKLAIEPDTLALFGATEFHAFGHKHGGELLLLYVFEYKANKDAAAIGDKAAGVASQLNLVHNGRVATRGNLLLIAGTEAKTAPTAAQKQKLDTFLTLFKR